MALPFLLVIVAFAAVVVILVVRSANNPDRRQNALNAKAPVQQALAKVVDKREEVRGASNQYGGQTTTLYYATFELPDAQRVELSVPGPTSGQLVVGDMGQLVWQGTWLRGFQRQLLR